MKIYICKLREPYSGGCLVVAANKPEQAEALADDYQGESCWEVIELEHSQCDDTVPKVLVGATYVV